ncbi:Predicted nucleic acid-binding protein, contains Zn-ribbon domain (includes truncated derivatives) [Nonomuraea maritima]|uniref:Predicted nucleic acid-binding protein, contains Zn-ribbon domain (Includes truncated derivatives) n=1 Tax=Nonomuraea maritima TaxID=683260 RepID=A0A1G9KRI9_9ACTN|nr:DciA family protein [Nonomuraea maritima]SDL52113.1 Predicted nucleic acid-binding protein, contains Zn-ribbon domain (includes truncated derivatives) [Nonomuraea maritima]
MSADEPGGPATEAGPGRPQGGGQPADGPAPEHVTARGVAMAREKLAQAKADAAKRGQLPRREPRRKKAGPSRNGGDPQLFGRAIADLLSDRGWERPVAVGAVFGRWRDIVGPGLAAHTKPESFEDGEVLVVADSTAWATQVRLLARTLVRRLNEELGDGTVTKVKVRGPQNAPRPSGGLRVTGSRGPGDTYG